MTATGLASQSVTTHVTSLSRPHVSLSQPIASSTLRRVEHIVTGVVLIVAGVLVATHASPEIGVALISAGVQQIVDVGVQAGGGWIETKNKIRPRSYSPALAL